MSVISDLGNEYNCYKKNNNSKALMSKTSKHRNIFRFLYLKNVERKYGQKLYDILGVMNDANELETVLSLGEKKILGLLKKGEFSACEFGDAISKDGQIPIKSDEKNYTLSRIRKCIVFNKVTGLNLIEFDGIGVNPKRSYRHTTRSMIQIFEDNDISKEDLEKIYNIYGTQILEEYTEDTFLRNKSTILQRDGCIAVGGLQDHTKVYTQEELDEIMQQYFQGKQMSKENKYILVGILQKSAQLIDVYSKQHLYEHPDYIKKEVDAGIFRDISVSGKVYSNDERKEKIKLGTVWDRSSIEKKNNLGILKSRLEKMLETSPC